jgi:hypothetical protein
MVRGCRDEAQPRGRLGVRFAPLPHRRAEPARRQVSPLGDFRWIAAATSPDRRC